ncbi:Uncharacterised protein [uncultured archaeon]|nr:Uncharacterised protein [uncultured archaeon]
MKKQLWIGIALVIIILLVIFGYNKYTQIKEIKTMNKIEFKFIKCITNCPIIISANKTLIKQDCLKTCMDENTVPRDLLIKYPKEQLIKDPGYAACFKTVDNTINYAEVQTCLIDLMPKLQEKYSYLK